MNIHLTPEQQKCADELAHMTSAEWDTICKQCGICCLSKYPFFPDPESNFMTTVFLKQCCEKFDLKNCKCSVYQTRLSVPHCEKVDMNLILNTKTLPASCGYVEYIFGPAPFPAHVDFSQVHPVPYDEEPTAEQFEKDMIKESVLWSVRSR